jgi:hypothetical protein
VVGFERAAVVERPRGIDPRSTADGSASAILEKRAASVKRPPSTHLICGRSSGV